MEKKQNHKKSERKERRERESEREGMRQRGQGEDKRARRKESGGREI